MRNSKFRIDRTKEGIKKRTFHGSIFASELELKFYRDYLIPLRNKGTVKEIVLQPRYLLQENFVKNKKKILAINYVADFRVVYDTGEEIVYDVKGLATSEAKLKRKIFDKVYLDKELQWVSYSLQDGGWIDYDKLQKLRAKRKREKNDKKYLSKTNNI
jgi:hypothetical protein